jgi:hypothetical protein
MMDSAALPTESMVRAAKTKGSMDPTCVCSVKVGVSVSVRVVTCYNKQHGQGSEDHGSDL